MTTEYAIITALNQVKNQLPLKEFMIVLHDEVYDNIDVESLESRCGTKVFNYEQIELYAAFPKNNDPNIFYITYFEFGL